MIALLERWLLLGHLKPAARRIAILATLGWVFVPIFFGARILLSSPKENLTKKPPEKNDLAQQRVLSRTNLRAQSCATSNCHGSMTPDLITDTTIRGDEYFVWSEDPHAHAYDTLLGSRSRDMFLRLGVQEEHLYSQAVGFQSHWKNCLGCHETNVQLYGPEAANDFSGYGGEGVSCESCHGNSQDWLHRHYRKSWNQSADNDLKRQLNFLHEGDSTGRIKACSQCHIGNENGEVDHDLIAAGHPALKFEYVWYRSRLPKHWKSSRYELKRTGVQALPMKVDAGSARQWLIGQLVMSIASLEQLERRANKNAGNHKWPELSEHNCFACHHDLHGRSWRAERVFQDLVPIAPGRSLVVAPWGNWNMDFITLLAEEFGSTESAGSKNAQMTFTLLGELRKEFQKSHVPANYNVAQRAAATRIELEKWLNETSQRPEIEVERLLQTIVRNQPTRLISSWDQTASLLLGFLARHVGSNDVPEELKTAMNQIRFPADPIVFDSPREFRSESKESAFSGKEWIELLRVIADISPNQHEKD